MQGERIEPSAWIATKRVAFDKVEAHLRESLARNQMTNGGPCVKRLEQFLAAALRLPDDRRLIAVCNGAAALAVLVAMYDVIAGERIRVATQAFTFPSAAQGILADRSVIVDVDPATGVLDTSLVPDDVRAVIVTNPLGNVGDVDALCRWGAQTGRLVLFDDAATPLTLSSDGRNALACGDGAIISMHHTKPIGFGEGGAVVVPERHEALARRLINFGYDMVRLDQIWMPQGSNAKMSEVAAAFILAHLDEGHFERMVDHHRRALSWWQDGLRGIGGVRLWPSAPGWETFPSCIVLLFDCPVAVTAITAGCARKYYKPLCYERGCCPVANLLYDRVLCLPCHHDVDDAAMEAMLGEVKRLAAAACIRDAENVVPQEIPTSASRGP